MDTKYINKTVLPYLNEVFFPEILIGELIQYVVDENGFQERTNKDKSPDDWDYAQNELVDITPEDILYKAKHYFNTSNFTQTQIESIFKGLDMSLERFKKKTPKSFVSFDWKNKCKNEKAIPEANKRQQEIINIYTALRNKLLGVKINKSTIDETALKYVYLGIDINRSNCNIHANDNNHKSGEKLYQRYIYFLNKNNRIVPPDPISFIKFRNKIELFESVFEKLPLNKRDIAKADLDCLKEKFINLYNDKL
ncbi:hypothetical protein [Pontimicrobium aquaticum]|uniref:Uncharacterized protein n=1 Tax=Pontimicrobium aquaticum TaxID=2565367 RepID=A0A4U0F1Q1_9FLAO|nr:hypothetical protein [Pontimicrobium aquaticum]TJY38200.1 hypothetical protein E5167_02800 [Pontimicrobium aquaticum]